MKHTFYNLECNNALIKPFSGRMLISEQQILDLQDRFLTNGLHYVNVPTLSEGRELVYTFLDALRCFDMVGCLCADSQNLREDIVVLTKENLREYSFDFIWIEQNLDQDTDYILHQLQEIPIMVLIQKKSD